MPKDQRSTLLSGSGRSLHNEREENRSADGGSQAVPGKSWVANILGLAGHRVPTAQLTSSCRGDITRWAGHVPIKLYLEPQAAGWTRPGALPLLRKAPVKDCVAEVGESCVSVSRKLGE